jgi:Uncharacterized small protein
MVSQINEARISESPAIDEDVLKEIKQALSQIQYGSLEISIHNGRIVQLERREKKRFDR